MSRLSRDLRRRKLEKLLGYSKDEPMIRLVTKIGAVLGGNSGARHSVLDLPEDAVGAEIGSKYYIAPWTLETFINELLCAPKHRVPATGTSRELRSDSYAVLRILTNLIIALENAEDGIFLEKHDVFTEMHRLGQRQFPWQRGMGNSPSLYRSLLLYGTGSAADYFERDVGLTTADFVKVGVWLARALDCSDGVNRNTDLSSISITPEVRERALSRVAISHNDACARARRMRATNLHTAYKPSILRDFPVIAFGAYDERLRAPLPALILERVTGGHYLDVVGGGPTVWSEIGERFEQYCVNYLSVMLAPYTVHGEYFYGPKKIRQRTPDVLVSDGDEVILVAECKAKRMTFEARFSEDPITDAATGYAEIAKGIFQIWRFLSHARRGISGTPRVRSDCLGILLTVDPWLTMARNQEEKVFAAAHALADKEGSIETADRCHVPVCLIDDVEFALQNGTATTFIDACRELSFGKKKGWILSVAHVSEPSVTRPYPFRERIGDILPWWPSSSGTDELER